MPEAPQVLVVDPDAASRTRTTDALETADATCRVETAADAAAVLARLRESPPDGVVSRIELPGLDGLALHRAVHEVDPSLPVVLLLDDAPGALGEAIEAGVGRVIASSSADDGVDLGTALRVADGGSSLVVRPPATLEAVVEAAPQALVGLGLEGRVRHWNPAAEALFGFREAEVVGRRPPTIPEDAADWFEARLAALREGRPMATIDAVRERRDGTEVAVTVTAAPLLDAEGDLLGSIGVFGEADAEAVARRAVRGALDRTQEAVISVDRDWRVTYLNRAARERVPVDPDDAIGRSAWDVFPALEGTAFADRYRRAMAEQEPVTFEAHYPPYDAWFEVRAYPDSTGLTVYYRDVTDEHEAARVSERAARVLGTMREGAYVVDADLRLAYVNDRVLEFTDLDRDAVVGQPLTWFRDLGLLDEAGYATFETAVRRVLEGDVEDTSVALDWAAPDDEPRASDLRVVAHDDPDAGRQALVVARDVTEQRTRERALETLHRATTSLLSADSVEAVGRVVVEAVEELVAPTAGTLYSYDDATGLLVPAATLDRDPDDVPLLRPGGSIAWRTYTGGESVVLEDVREDPDVAEPDTDLRAEVQVPVGEHGVLVASHETPGYFDEGSVDLLETLAASAEVALDRIAGARALRERDRALKRQHRRLERATRLMESLRDLNRVLVRGESTAAVAGAVCDQLVDLPSFAYAWLGEHDPAAGGLERVADAGEAPGYLDAEGVTDDPGGDEPATAAARTDEVTHVAAIADEVRAEPWRSAALARDLRSALAVPLVYEGVRYGVLAVYADRPHAFDDLVRSVLTEFGETLAYALNALERRAVLTGRPVAELDFEADDGAGDLPALARSTGCELTYQGPAGGPGERRALFVRFEGTAPADAVAALEADDRVEDVRLVRSGTADGVVELRLVDPFVGGRLATHGLVLRSMTADADGARFTVVAYSRTTARGAPGVVTAVVPGATLVAKRQVVDEPAPPTAGGRLVDGLTGRQREVLLSAYHAGYFEEPRQVTGGELAERLGISSPTFHHHLRRAQARLLSGLLDGGPPGGG